MVLPIASIAVAVIALVYTREAYLLEARAQSLEAQIEAVSHSLE